MSQVKNEAEVLLKPLHAGISVPDIDTSITWYRQMLGFRLVSDKYFEQLPARIAFLELGDFSIELFQVQGAAPLPDDRRVPNLDIRTHGIKHVAYIVEESRLGTAYGLMTMIQNIGLAGFNFMIGWVNDISGDYTAGMMIFSTLGFFGLVFAWLLRRHETSPQGHGLERRIEAQASS